MEEVYATYSHLPAESGARICAVFLQLIFSSVLFDQIICNAGRDVRRWRTLAFALGQSKGGTFTNNNKHKPNFKCTF